MSCLLRYPDLIVCIIGFWIINEDFAQLIVKNLVEVKGPG